MTDYSSNFSYSKSLIFTQSTTAESNCQDFVINVNNLIHIGLSMLQNNENLNMNLSVLTVINMLRVDHENSSIFTVVN